MAPSRHRFYGLDSQAPEDELPDDPAAEAALPWTPDKGKPGRGERIRASVALDPGATAIEVVRALGLNLHPYGGYGWPVWQALRAGVIRDEREGAPGRYSLVAVSDSERELARLREAAEAEPDLLRCMELIDMMGDLIREQAAAFTEGGGE